MTYSSGRDARQQSTTELFPPVDAEVIEEKSITQEILEELRRRYSPAASNRPSGHWC